MSPDLIAATTIFAFLLGLAVAAPIWGYDGRDGVESDQYARRAPWLYDRQAASRSTSVAGSGSRGSRRLAGASLMVRHRHHHDDAELCGAAALCIPAA
jgi:hypothetical protein